MLKWLVRILVFPVILLLFCGCEDSNSAGAQNAKLKEELSQDLVSNWRGILAEKSTFRAITISLMQNEEKVTGTLVIGSGVGRSYLNLSAETEIPVEGTFDPVMGYARLLTQSGARTGEYVFEIAQTPAGAIGKFAIAGKHGSKGSRRGEAVFFHPSEAEHLEHLEQTLAVLNDRSKTPVDAETCPRQVVSWIKEANLLRQKAKHPAEILQAFSLDAFENAFGEHYSSISAQQLKVAQGLLQGPCAEVENARQLSYMVADAKTYKDTHYRRIENPIVEAWWNHVKAVVSTDLKLSLAQLDNIQPLFQTFELGQYYHNYRKELAPVVLARKQALREEELRLSRLALMEKYTDRFDLMLLTARAQLKQYPDTQDLVTAKLDQLALKAAEQYADGASSLNELQYMVSFVGMTESGVGCVLSRQKDCEKIAKLFDKKSESLADQLVDTLIQDTERQIPQNEDLQALIQHVQFAQKVQRRYGNALTIGELEDIWEEITDERQSLQEDLYDELYSLIDNSNNARAIVRTEQQYFFQDDVKQKGMKKLNALLSEKLAELAPFRDLQGGEYLNALLNRDTKALIELDQHYTQGYKPLVALAGEAMSLISPSARQEFSVFSRNMTAVNPLFASYILGYQNTYPDCLGKDPVIATVSTTTTETKKDGFGFEISRNAWTDYDEYTIPRRLAPHFEKLWRSDFSGDAVASDALFNDQKIGKLIRSLKKVTEKYSCDHPHIKALEGGMIAYYSR